MRKEYLERLRNEIRGKFEEALRIEAVKPDYETQFQQKAEKLFEQILRAQTR